jgi:fructosamine-3-kinase
MTEGAAFSLVQRFSVMAACAGADLLTAMDRAIAADATASRLSGQSGARVAVDVQTRLDAGAVRIKSVLWSVQVAGVGPYGLAARSARLGRDGVAWFDLVDDPALPLHALPDGARMLRYIPGRRATLLVGDGADRHILKLKKPDRRDDAVLRHRAALIAARGIAMPGLLGLQGDHGFCQTLCPGTALDQGPCSNETLRAVGQMIATLHQQDGAALPPAPDGVDAAGWLTAILPSLDLTSILSGPQGGQTLCHGDLALGQILDGPQGLFLVDLDRCHCGDAAADLARFLVSLQDEPALVDWRAAASAICEGYRNCAPLPIGLKAALARAEVEQLQVLLSKGLATTRRIRAGLEQAGVAWHS